MPFENFYEESDKARRRWWKCFGLAFLLFIGYWAFALLMIPSPESSKPPIQKPTYTEHLQRATQLCANLPQPEQFNFIGSDLSTPDSQPPTVYFVYKADRSPDEIFPVFLVWFDSNGWKLSDKQENKSYQIPQFRSLTFRNNAQIISVKYEDWNTDNNTRRKLSFPAAWYEISCKDETVSFGIYE